MIQNVQSVKIPAENARVKTTKVCRTESTKGKSRAPQVSDNRVEDENDYTFTVADKVISNMVPISLGGVSLNMLSQWQTR